jgi:hypothetical protein
LPEVIHAFDCPWDGAALDSEKPRAAEAVRPAKAVVCLINARLEVLLMGCKPSSFAWRYGQDGEG